MIDPIILDLDGNGLSFSSLAEGVSFDLDADGRADRVAWNTSNDGILALDVDGSGTIDNGGEIFTPHFAGGDYETGSEALASLDDNGDGVIDAGDKRFGELLVWKDANADGIAQEDELSNLADNGIASIDLKTVATGAEVDGQAVLGEGASPGRRQRRHLSRNGARGRVRRRGERRRHADRRAGPALDRRGNR